MQSSHAFLLVCLFLQLPLLLQAHGYLSSPPPRGIEKQSYQIDDLKSPNKKGLCRGEKEGKVTNVHPGDPLTLGLTITAPHTGICTVSLLDLDLTNEQKFDEKFDCAAPGKVAPWTVKLPAYASGRKVLRWYWEGCHVSPCEKYEQCIDLDFGGSGGSPAEGNSYKPPKNEHPEPENHDNGPRPAHIEEKPQYDGDDKRMPSPVSGRYTGGDELAHAMKQNNAIQRQVDQMMSKKKPRKDPPKKNLRNSIRSLSSVKSYSGMGNKGNNQKEKYDDQQSSQKCHPGVLKCSGTSHFVQCANNKWVKMPCGPGTHCKKLSGSIICK